MREAIPAEQQERLQSGPPFVYFRFRGRSFPKESTDNLLVGTWSFRRLARQVWPKGRPTSPPTIGDANEAEVLCLLCNDYLFRDNADRMVVTGTTKAALKGAKFDLADAKTDHQRRIETYLQTYVGSPE